MSAGRKINGLSQEWGTPQKYVDAVRRFFDGTIELDPCSNEYSIVNAQTEYRLPQQDGLDGKDEGKGAPCRARWFIGGKIIASLRTNSCGTGQWST